MSTIPLTHPSPTQALHFGSQDASFNFTATAYSDLRGSISNLFPGQPNLGFTSLQAKGILRGQEIWIFTRPTADRREVVAFGVLTRGLFNASLDVCVMPCVTEQDAFWGTLQHFISRMSVTSLLVESIGLPRNKAAIPKLPGECQRYANVKLYVVNLESDSWAQGVSSNHRRNINKARKHGVKIVTSTGSAAIEAHLALIGASLVRRANRGEPTNLASDAEEVKEILSNDAAQLYQATIDGEVVSSKIVFTVGDYAFYDSGGTSEKGMRVGASHFLMFSLMWTLHGQGIKSLNLDVASKAAGGLARYKAEFGAQLWEVDRVECQLKSLPKRIFNTLRAIRERIHPTSPAF
ncbi:MAG: GNAT family N-acetyltransferase [Gammaproteobacteria bacterium]